MIISPKVQKLEMLHRIFCLSVEESACPKDRLDRSWLSTL